MIDQKKKILFVINQMNMGGIQKSLVNLLCCIYKQYDISLLCINPEGKLLDRIPDEIRRITPGIAVRSSEMSLKDSFHLSITAVIDRLFFSAWSKICNKRIPAYIATKWLQKNLGYYDIAISYSQPINHKQFCCLCNEVVLNSCSSPLKITFVHCDFTNYGGNNPCNRDLYKRFNKIAAVSNSVGEKFKHVIPETMGKVGTVYNLNDFVEIRSLALDDTVQYDEDISVVTVARISNEKGLLRCIDVINQIFHEGYEIKWHIVGDGPLMHTLRQAIVDINATQFILLHGQQSNPYRFIKNASFLLLPSFHEAAPMVYNEAACLHVPVLTTNTTSAIELVERRGIGWVCGNTSNEIYESMLDIIQNKRYSEIRFQDEDYTNDLALKQFCKLIGE